MKIMVTYAFGAVTKDATNLYTSQVAKRATSSLSDNYRSTALIHLNSPRGNPESATLKHTNNKRSSNH